MHHSHFLMPPTDVPTGKVAVLQYSGCPDCYVVKGDDDTDAMMLTSKEKKGII